MDDIIVFGEKNACGNVFTELNERFISVKHYYWLC